MYICRYCKTATETVSEWHGEKIHVCASDCYDLAIDIDNHDCSKFQEEAYTPEGILVTRCFICTEAVEQGLHPTSGILPDLQTVSTPQPLATPQSESTPPTCG